MNGGYSPAGTTLAATDVFRMAASAEGTNASVIKAASGSVFQVSGYNTSASGCYLKLYNKATAPTVGTDTPRWSEYLPPQERFAISMSAAPLLFSDGISFALATGALDTDNAGVGAGDIMGINISFT